MGNYIFVNFHKKYSCSRCLFYPDKSLRKRCSTCEFKFEEEIMDTCSYCLNRYEKYDKFGDLHSECISCEKRHRKYYIERSFEEKEEK